MPARLSLAQQIALLKEAAPVDLDPEDVHVRDVEAQEGLGVSTDPAAREHYFEVGPSSLRKQHDSISDPKYDGARTTRRQLIEQDSDEEMSDDDKGSGLDDEEQSVDGAQASSGVEHADSSEDDEISSHSEEEEEDQNPPPRKTRRPEKRSAEEPESGEDLSAELRKKREEDRKKGKAVVRQIALWDSLLDARIRMQKAIAAANRLPPPLDVKEYLVLPECQDSINKMLKEAVTLSEEIFQLQEHLLTTNESITPPPRKRRKIQADEDIPVDYAEWLENATEDASALEQVYHPHLVQTLAKWSSKIQAVAPSVLLPKNRNAFSSRGSQNLKTVPQLIDETLADQNKILARTQVRRGKGRRTGVLEAPDDAVPEEDPNIFDDTDFYQQLLRDIIDSRGNAIGGDDWMAVQKEKKAKKKVDTKASKGRKLRYETHEKLQNFMVPVPIIAGWHEEQIDELFASLLGKGFETSVQGDEDDVDDVARRQEEARLDEALKGGFRGSPTLAYLFLSSSYSVAAYSQSPLVT
ncbi:putative TRAUB-domain-containing protein [Lyophyllum shimeji]|uniref:Protein BFR2 n=1 Tax=Lyophyllum shimeji TaxID=47721 RepID=A0A9P3UT07_LYOSH|nr:putative TRAUB-domain-containing protein [Lyophyllum shimeji]